MDQHLIYGLSSEEHQRLVARAAGCCEMCSMPSDSLGIDHCHDSDRVRGLLCSACNTKVMAHEKGRTHSHLAAAYLQACPAMLGDGRYAVTPVRNIRVSDETWQAAKARADQEGWTMSQAVRSVLLDYIERRV